MSTRTDYDLSAMFEPLDIRNITLKSRFAMPAMQRRWCEDGKPAERLGRYYRRRVQAGTALIITEACAIDHPSATQGTHYGRLRPDTKDAWRVITEEVRGAGGHIFIQLWHEGGVRKEGGDGPYSKYPSLSPSGYASSTHENGRAATRQELDDIKDAFVRAAIVAKEAGASGCEIHGAHGFLLDQFLWRGTNRRTDEYGGDDIRDRVRYPAEIVAEVRAAVGEDFVISFRCSQWKEEDYEAKVVDNPAELETMLGVLREAGVDVFNVSARRFWTAEWPGSDLGFAGWAKQVTDAKIIAVGSVGLDTPVMEDLRGEAKTHATGEQGFAELQRRFERGDFDVICVGRSQIANPDWVQKVRQGKLNELQLFTRDHLAIDEDALEASGALGEFYGAPT